MLEIIGSWPGAAWLQQSGTAYLLVNAAHILGIGILLGGILPLDLRLMGLFGRYPLEVLGPFLTRTAASGFSLALVSGAWLFTVKPAEYLQNDAFRWKLALLTLALLNVAIQYLTTGARASRLTPATRLSAALSFSLWLGVLIAGRWIGFL